MRVLRCGGPLRTLGTVLFIAFCFDACASNPNELPEENGAADVLNAQRDFFRAAGLQHGAVRYVADEAASDGGVGTREIGPPPHEIVVDFVDVTGDAPNRAGDAPAIHVLRGMGRPPTTESLAAAMIEEINRRLQEPNPGVLPLLRLGDLRTVPARATIANGWDAVAARGRFSFVILNDSQVLADGPPIRDGDEPRLPCGYYSPQVLRAIMLSRSCVEQYTNDRWTTNTTPYYLRTLSEAFAHEFGHWLGLSHTFGDSADAVPQDCIDRDGIADTPPHRETGYDYNDTVCDALPPNSCAGYDTLQHPFLNIMSYASCTKSFTLGQIERMRRVWLRSYVARGFAG